MTFTDLAMAPNADGIWDLVIDETTSDLKTTQGLEVAILMSLFTDRRAAPDEVADPLKRRGWIGNLTPDKPADNFGSGLWLYEQRRGTQDVLASLKMEALHSLAWLKEDGLASDVDASFAYDPRLRKFTLRVLVTNTLGQLTSHAFNLWSKTAAVTIRNT